jgi:hypothetical protein
MNYYGDDNLGKWERTQEKESNMQSQRHPRDSSISSTLKWRVASLAHFTGLL